MKLLVSIFLMLNTYYGEGSPMVSGSSYGEKMVAQLDLFLDDEALSELVPLVNAHLENVTKSKREIDDIKLLRKLFYRTHARFLQRYEQYVPMSSMLPGSGGSYDCLTATALFAVMLDKMGYSYTIHELEYHVYLTVQLPNTQILIETTDPIAGFETDSKRIANRITSYSNISSQLPQVTQHEGEVERVNLMPEINNTIGIKELAGLLYYNLAVREFNAMQFEQAKKNLQTAKSLYDCPRVRGLIEIIALNQSQGISMR